MIQPLTPQQAEWVDSTLRSLTMEQCVAQLCQVTKPFSSADEWLEFLEEVRTRTRANESSMQAMDAVTKELLRQAEGLRNEVGRFRV